MPAFTRSEPDILVVQFDRDGEPPETQVVMGGAGERVLLYAIEMLVRKRTLRLHDPTWMPGKPASNRTITCGFPPDYAQDSAS